MNWKKRNKLRETVKHYNNKYGRLIGRNINPCEYKYVIQSDCLLYSAVFNGFEFWMFDKYGSKGYRMWEDRMYREDV